LFFLKTSSLERTYSPSRRRQSRKRPPQDSAGPGPPKSRAGRVGREGQAADKGGPKKLERPVPVGASKSPPTSKRFSMASSSAASPPMKPTPLGRGRSCPPTPYYNTFRLKYNKQLTYCAARVYNVLLTEPSMAPRIFNRGVNTLENGKRNQRKDQRWKSGRAYSRGSDRNGQGARREGDGKAGRRRDHGHLQPYVLQRRFSQLRTRRTLIRMSE
jgi:hypothetical protein